MAFTDFIGNCLDHGPGDAFAAILGAAPSQGARSPALWNAAFKAHGQASVMLPLDVSVDNLDALLEALDADPGFMGGAVAVPHKETTAVWLGARLTPETAKIGAVNCLYRGADGCLWGTNTDGAGALACLQDMMGDLAGKRALLLGPGGAGKAVAAYLAAALGGQGGLVIAARNPSGTEDFAARIGAGLVSWPPSQEALAVCDILVNCTSLGSAAAGTAGESPLEEARIAALSEHALVYDIIYDPSPTRLMEMALARGLKTLDGSCMNLEQAILGFGQAAEESAGCETTRQAMGLARDVLG